MPLLAGSIIQATFRYTCAGQRLLNICHFVNDVDIDGEIPAIQATMANYIGSSVSAVSPARKIISLLPENITLDFVRVQVIRDNRWAYTQKDVGLDGELTATPVPNICVVLTKRTIDSDPDQVGAFHLPGVPADEMADGFVSLDFRTTVRDEMEFLVSPMTWSPGAPDIFPVILHPPLVVPDYTKVASIIVQPEVRVMVRRTVGRGE
jgi:hypothetical protein